MVPAGLTLWLNPGRGEGHRDRVDWVGLLLLAFFMVMLVHGLRELGAARSEPAAAIVPLALAAIAFAALLRVETRRSQPLLDFALFRNQNFALGCALAFLLMFDIMALLLYYNIFAQAADGLDKTAVAAGLSLMPLSIALFSFARMAPWLASVVGTRRMMVAGSLLLLAGCATAWASVAGAGFAVLLLGPSSRPAQGSRFPTLLRLSSPSRSCRMHNPEKAPASSTRAASSAEPSASPPAGSSLALPASKACWRWWGSLRWSAQDWQVSAVSNQ
jgi:hypothetical protein